MVRENVDQTEKMNVNEVGKTVAPPFIPLGVTISIVFTHTH